MDGGVLADRLSSRSNPLRGRSLEETSAVTFKVHLLVDREIDQVMDLVNVKVAALPSVVTALNVN